MEPSEEPVGALMVRARQIVLMQWWVSKSSDLAEAQFSRNGFWTQKIRRQRRVKIGV